LPEAVLLGTADPLPETGAGLVAAVEEGAGAGDELPAVDDALTDAELAVVGVLLFELEQPANATAATTIGSHTRRCIFTAHSVTGSMEELRKENSSRR
jgi:hypothetical protein